MLETSTQHEDESGGGVIHPVRAVQMLEDRADDAPAPEDVPDQQGVPSPDDPPPTPASPPKPVGDH